ncbi:TonB-dependent receptor [Flavobacterium plurextorum]|uniref:TonB-dependent receptor n=1 Tax=Flavobacterium quisquiliarum TaxID=1834436 RepID=A0ABV8W2E7_9FLAO|nr:MULTISPECIES: TonB-dependent receptor [Flavobacterium]MBW1656014.1 TonB-dependent receptor [Flavobacterium quisquiliarum]UUW07221.1 TonB-dependent receptor [Flavobacterium plurextorum]
MTPKIILKSLFKQEKIFKKILFTAVFSVCSLASNYAQTIKGVVTSDAGTLPTANIAGKTFNNSAISDLQGAFTLTAPSEGEVTIEISYIGFETKSITVTLVKGINDLGLIQMSPDGSAALKEIVVKGTMAPSQAKAYSIKKNSLAIMDVMAADAIGKLPDRNAAEAVQRMQGVAVARYHGEADQATVRGTPFAWTSTLFNGNRLPSSNVMGNRSSVLDAVPSEMIQYVQVAKAITPDMEGDAIGGSINFITRTAPTKRVLNVSAAGGYNTFSENGTYNASVTYGDRFFNNKLGIIVSGAIWSRQWGSDEFAATYNTGATVMEQKKSLNTVLFKRYMGERETKGLNVGAEYKLTSSDKIFFRAMANKFDDIRPVYESYIDYTNSRFQYNYRYSHYQTALNGFEVGGEHQMSEKFKLDWSYSNHKSEYYLDTPPTSGNKGLPIATFRQKITGGFNDLSSDGKRYWGFDSPNGVGGTVDHFETGLANPNEVMDPTKLLLNQLVIAQLDNSERDQIGQVNLKVEASSKVNLKFGAKYRHKDRTNTYGSNYVYLPGAAVGIPNSPALVPLSALQTTSFPSGSKFFANMNGDFNSFIVNPLTKDQLFNMYGQSFQTANGFMDFTSKTNATSFYTGDENVIAGYAMAEIDATDNLKIVGGLRNEYTAMTLNGTKATTTGTPAVITLSPSVVENNYNSFLPMLHLKYKLNDKSNLRAAYTRTFVRPNFGDMTPGSSTNTTSSPQTITQGNPDLKPTFSNNFDLMGEYYFDNVGILSGGAFYKNITDVVFTDVSMQNVDGSDYLVTQAKNLNKASLYGFEAGINKRFDFLNGFWSGFGVEFNYTFIDSNTEVPRVNGTAVYNDKTSLPNQSKNLFNAILFYERNGVMVRLAGNYRGKSVETINQQLGPDYYIWTDSNFTIDASATVNINKKLKVFIELNNLSDSPVKMFMGNDKRRITSQEWYGSRGQAGIRYDIF